jgi:hypothetical protein
MESFVENKYFSWPLQKDKKAHHETAYFSTKFYYFYIDQIISRFFLKQLRGHVEHGDVPKIFLCEFLIF